MAQADLVYQMAMQKAKGDKKLEPAAICNYATFVCRQRKNPHLAYRMFTSGLEKFPHHKGLVKNFELLVKGNPGIASPSAVQVAKEKRVHTPSSKSKVRRALAMANSDVSEGAHTPTMESPTALFIDSPRLLREYETSAAAVSHISPMAMAGTSSADKPSSPSLAGIDRERMQRNRDIGATLADKQGNPGMPPTSADTDGSTGALGQLRKVAENFGDYFAVDEDADAGVYRDDDSSEDEEEESDDEKLYSAP